MDWIIVAIAGFLGGMLNAVAGGGSFIMLPALIFVGVTPISANATGTAALLPGYIASAWRFRKNIELPANLGFLSIALIAVLGGCLGAVILLVSSERIFLNLIPWLILFATIVFIIGPQLIQSKISKNTETGQKDERLFYHPITISLILFCICVYGGYFNGGLGIIMLAALGLMGQTNLQGMNGLKNFLSALLTAVAVVVYSVGDTITIKYLFVAGVMAVFGGYLGASIAYRLSQVHLRNVIVVVGFLMSGVFFFKTT